MHFVNDKDMRGSARVRNRIINSLVVEIPPIQDRLRAQWQQDENSFPSVDNYDEGEPRAFAHNQHHALIAVNVGSSNRMTVVDWDEAGAELFRKRYQVRVYLYIKTASGPNEGSYERAVRLRDMTTALVEAAILSRPSFNTTDMELIHDSLSTQYSDFTTVKGNRWVGAVYFPFDVAVEEQLVRPTLGEVAHYRIETMPMEAPQ